MEEHKTDTASNDANEIDVQLTVQVPSNLKANTSQKEKDLKFLDLGWGLGSIDLHNPYKKEFITLGYTMASFILALMIVFIKSYIAVLVVAVLNVIFQISVFAWCAYKYQSRAGSKHRASLERNLSMSVDSALTRSGSMSPTLAAEYLDSYVDDQEQEKRRVTTLFNHCLCFRKYHDFFASFDETFGRGDDPVFIRPYYFRFSAVLYGVLTSTYALCIIAIYANSPLNICPSSYAYDFIYGMYHPTWAKQPYQDHLESVGRVQCMCTTYIYDFGTIYWLFLIGFSVFDSYELKTKYYTRTTKIIRKALKTFSENNIKELHDRVEYSIYGDVKSKMQIVSNIGRVTALYTVWCVMLFFWRYSAFGVISFPILFFPMFEAMITTNICMVIYKICILSKYPVAISKIFGEPIYCHTRDDVLAWWQLRHIYETYRMPIYIKVLRPVIFIGFVFIVLLPFWAVMTMIANAKAGRKFYAYPVQFSITIVLIFTILFSIKQFVASYEKQKTHIGMLEKEVIRLEVNKDDFEALEDLIERISKHMEKFDKPIHIAGVPMTNAVFTLLRGAFSGIALLIVAEMVTL
eukprot:662950_1